MKKQPVGRPTIYTKKLAKDICNKIASNSKGLMKLCAENPHWPNKDTIFTWLKTHPEFSDQYARARRLQIEAFIDDIIDIADETTNDYRLNDQGEIIPNGECIARSRLRIDARKWLASKLVPKIYGSKLTENIRSQEDCTEELKRLSAELDLKYRKDY